MVEQGTSFTIIRTPSPLREESGPTGDPRQDFLEARRFWLGYTDGTDWLLTELEQELSDDVVAYEIESNRRAIHIGASGEVASIALVLLGVGALDIIRKFYGGFVERLGEASADAFLEWARERSRAHRERAGLTNADGPPDFYERDAESLAEGLRGELADLLGVKEDRLELTRASREPGLALKARYRSRDTGIEYEAEVMQDAASFVRVGADVARAVEKREWTPTGLRDLVSRLRRKPPPR